MEVANIDVKTREERGRREVARLRSRDEIPAVVYGKGEDNLHLSIPGGRFTQLVLSHHKLFELHLEGGSLEEAFLQDLQWDAIDDVILHADFKRIDLNERMKTVVDLRMVGQPKGLVKNGIFDVILSQLRIECLPADLPDEIRVNVNDLDVGDAVQVTDLALPEGVVALDPAGHLVCQCKLRHETVEEEEEAAAAAAAPPTEGAGGPEVIGKDKKEDGGTG